MNPLLAQIRGQLPNETVPFGLLVRGKVIEGKRAEYIEAARRLQEGTQKEPGNIFYRFFWGAQDPLKYVLLEAWAKTSALWFRRHTSRPLISSEWVRKVSR